MRRVLAVVASAAVVLVLVLGQGRDSVAQSPPVWAPVGGLPLKDPAQVHPNAAGTVTVQLTSEPKTINVSGSPLGARPFSSDAAPTSLNGPTIHVRPGGTIKVIFANRLGPDVKDPHPPTNIHYHGLHVSPLGISDNIFRTFDNGKTYLSVVHVPLEQTKGTFWYHVHLHGISEGQVMGGLSGLLIIDDLSSELPPGLRSVPERQLALRDVQVSGDAIVDQANIAIPGPSTRLVNALYRPSFRMREGRYELWRLANIGADVFYKLEFRNRAKPASHARFAVIAEDGVPVWDVEKHDTLLMPPGKRYDVLVRANDPGTYDLMSLKYAQRYVFTAAAPPAPASLDPKPLPVEVIDGNRTPVDQRIATATVLPSTDPITPLLPTSVGPKEDFSHDHVDHKRTFRFQYTPPSDPNFATMINDKVFSPYEMPLAAPVKDMLEEWTLINQTTDDHPFHIHVNPFQVMSVNGKPYHATGHQDIVNIPAQTLVNGQLVDGKVVIRQMFKRFTGWFVFHCHILQHEDAGMMATVQVRGKASDPIEQPPEYRGPDPGHGGHSG